MVCTQGDPEPTLSILRCVHGWTIQGKQATRLAPSPQPFRLTVLQEGQENQIDLPGDGPVAIDRFIRYLYVGDPDEVVHGISETPPPSLEYLSSLFTTFATADKYFAWGLKTHILELLADYLHARPPVELRFVSWKSCQEKMTPAEFVRTRVGLIKMAYEWDVPGVKTLRKEIASVLTSGWLPQLMKFNAMVDVMLSNPQLGVDLLCEDVEVADGTQHLSI